MLRTRNRAKCQEPMGAHVQMQIKHFPQRMSTTSMILDPGSNEIRAWYGGNQSTYATDV